MKKLLIVFNTCGLGLETIPYYKEALDSIYTQKAVDFDITIASCLHPEEIRQELQKLYPKIDIYAIDQKLPIHASFNHAIIETLKHRPNDYDGYVYFEAGAVLETPTSLSVLAAYLPNQNSKQRAGIIVPVSPHDNGLNLFFGINQSNNDISEIDKLFKGNCWFVFPPGMATNLHVAVYSRQLFDYYGKLQPDIFTAHTMESTLSFMCGALKTQWLMIKDVKIQHRKLNTIDSICFDPYEWKRQGNQNWNHPFIIPDIIDRLLPSLEYGGGYEECSQVMMHDESKWDENYYCLDDRLAPFYKENLFLQESELPHESIKAHFMMGER
jgi:hypothetical protein